MRGWLLAAMAVLGGTALACAYEDDTGYEESCCKTCGADSQACGDSCISLDDECSAGPGCACEG